MQGVLCLAFHPKLPVLASAGLDGFCVWNLADGTLSTRVLSGQGREGHDGAVECLLYIYDGATLLTGGRDANMCAWDAQNDYAHLETITGHKGHVLCMDYAPQTDLLVSGGRELQIKIWASAALNPSQRRRHAEDASCRVSLVQNIDAYSGDVTVLKWLREGSVLVSGARDNSVRLWDRVTGKLVRSVHGAHGDIRGIFFINQERLMLVASADGNVRLYELLADMSVANDAAATDTSDAANFRTRVLGEYAIAQRLLTTSTATDRLVHTFSAHPDDISNMALNSSLPLLATSNTYNVVRVWNIQNLLQPAMLHELVGHRGSVTSVHLLRKDGAILSASEDYFVHVFDTHSLHRFATIPFGASANATAVDEVNELVYIGGNDYVIQAWRLNGLASVRTTPALARSSTMSGGVGGSAAAGSASASRVRSSSSTAPGGTAGTPTALATITAEQVARLEGHSGRVIAMAVSPDGQVLVTSSHDFNLLTWDMRGLVDDAGSTSNRRASKTMPSSSDSGAAGDDAAAGGAASGQRAAQRVIRRAHETSGHSGRVTAMAFNDDGSLLATGGADRQVCLWRVHGVALSPLMQVKNAHSAVVCSVTFGRHKSAGLLASSSWDATIKLWALPMADEQTSSSVARATASGDANTPVAVLTGHSARVTSIEVTDDGAQLVSASCDLTARVWSLSPPYAQVALYRAQVNGTRASVRVRACACPRALTSRAGRRGIARVALGGALVVRHGLGERPHPRVASARRRAVRRHVRERGVGAGRHRGRRRCGRLQHWHHRPGHGCGRPSAADVSE